jgi:hypothetical protein
VDVWLQVWLAVHGFALPQQEQIASSLNAKFV